MQALRVTLSVTDGYLHIAVPPEMGGVCEVIILPLEDDQSEISSLNTTKMQEQSGFVQKVLGDSSEDVWNDL